MTFSGHLMKAVDFVASANLRVLAKCALRPIEPATDRAVEVGCHEDRGETKWGIGQVLPADQWGLEQSMGAKAQEGVEDKLKIEGQVRAPSLVKLEVLRVLLWNYPNKVDGAHLWDNAGFRIPFTDERIYVRAKNLKFLVGIGHLVKINLHKN